MTERQYYICSDWSPFMFYIMYVYYSGSNENLINILLDYFHADTHKDNDGDLPFFCTEGFTLNLNQGTPGIEYASDDYSVQLNLCFWFDIITSHEIWADDLIRFVDHLLVRISGDLVLEANGDRPILLRKTGCIYVDRNYGNGLFPFDLMTVAREDRPLKRDWKT